MPLARYFVVVGGVLLALLFLADASLPKFPTTERARANLPLIRIHSEWKWPQRIVYDTGQPTGISTSLAALEPDASVDATSADIAFGPKQHEAFAQLQPPDAERLPRVALESRPQKSPPRHKFTRKGMPRFAMAWFGKSFW